MFFNGFLTIWVQTIFLKKKVQKGPKMVKMCIFDLQRGSKIQNLNLLNMAKNCIERVFGNKKRLQKPFFVIWGEKKFFWKKNVKFAQKSQKNVIFRNFYGRFFGRKQTKSADLWPEGPFGPQVFPKFFLSHKRTKIRDFISKKHTPPKKGPF